MAPPFSTACSCPVSPVTTILALWASASLTMSARSGVGIIEDSSTNSSVPSLISSGPRGSALAGQVTNEQVTKELCS
jgi:hypothetical protein